MYKIKNVTNGNLKLKSLNKILSPGEVVNITTEILPEEINKLKSYKILTVEIVEKDIEKEVINKDPKKLKKDRNNIDL